MVRITIAQKLKQFREMRGVSQEELADRLAVSVGTIRNWEKGVGEPTMTYAEEISRFLDVDILQLHNEDIAVTDSLKELVAKDSEKVFEELHLKESREIRKWLDGHPKQRFKIGYNDLSMNFRSPGYLGSIYNLELLPYANDTAAMMVAVDSLIRKGHLFLNGHIGSDLCSGCMVYLRDVKEAEQFTYDLATELCVSPAYRDERGREIFCKANETLLKCGHELSEQMNRLRFGEKGPRYLISVDEKKYIPLIAAKDDECLVEIIDAIRAASFEIIIRDGEKRKNLDAGQSFELYKKLKAKQ